MSIEDDRMGAAGGNALDGWMEFAHKLYSKDHLEYHTEILHPDAMTFLDRTASYFGTAISPAVGKFIRDDNKDFRVNMVAYDRKRAQETERIAKGKMEEEKESKKMKDIMLGMNR